MAITLIGGAGATSILNNFLSQPKPGEFVPKLNAAANIQRTLGQTDTRAGQRQIFATALNRLEGVRQGIIQPNPDSEWETLGSFFAATGQPFKLFIDERGQLSAQAQADGAVEEFSQAQQLGIYSAIEQFNEIAEQVDYETQRNQLLDQYILGAAKLAQLENFFPAIDQWEKDFQFHKNLGNPVQVGLNADGELTAINQLEHDFLEVEDIDDRLKLLQARDELANILSGRTAATENWHFSALGSKIEKDDFLIVLNEDKEIEIRQNLHRDSPVSPKSLNHIVPDFLKEEVEIEYTRPWQEEAANLYRQGKSFYFDYDNTGRNLVAQEHDIIHIMGLHRPVDRSALVGNALVSLIS